MTSRDINVDLVVSTSTFRSYGAAAMEMNHAG